MVAKFASATIYPRVPGLAKASQVVPKLGFPPFVDHCRGQEFAESSEQPALRRLVSAIRGCDELRKITRDRYGNHCRTHTY